MIVVNELLKLFTGHHLKIIDCVRKDSLRLQEAEFIKLISIFSETEYGKQFGITPKISITEFQCRVPAHFYGELKPSIEQMIRGRSNVLWNEKIKYFAKSSGTSGERSKYIPISSEALKRNHFAVAKALLALYVGTFPDTKIFKGKGITLGGSQQNDFPEEKAFIGDLSSILISNTPFFYDVLRIPKRRDALLGDFERKVELIYQQSKRSNVTHFMGVPSWNLILMQKILEFSGKKNLLEIWENLELFVHGGVSFKPYRAEFQKLIPSDRMRYIETYNASEGFFAFQDDYTCEGMLLLTGHGIFYEFIPMESFHTESPKFITLGEVRENVNYAIVITTNSGLYRYIIGDTIKFISVAPYRLLITGRTQHYINTFGEEVIVDNAERALEKASVSMGVIVREYTVAPIFMKDRVSGRHQWLIEFATPPEDLEQFTELLDNNLRELNSDYDAKRKNNITLQILLITVLPDNTFYNFYKEKNKLGGQNKIPRLSNDRSVAESLLSFIQ